MGKAAKIEAYGKAATGYSSISQLADGGHGMKPMLKKASSKPKGSVGSVSPRGVGVAKNKPCKMY